MLRKAQASAMRVRPSGMSCDSVNTATRFAAASAACSGLSYRTSGMS